MQPLRAIALARDPIGSHSDTDKTGQIKTGRHIIGHHFTLRSNQFGMGCNTIRCRCSTSLCGCRICATVNVANSAPERAPSRRASLARSFNSQRLVANSDQLRAHSELFVKVELSMYLDDDGCSWCAETFTRFAYVIGWGVAVPSHLRSRCSVVYSRFHLSRSRHPLWPQLSC